LGRADRAKRERVKKILYRDAGVDIDKGSAFVPAIKPMVESTFRPEVLTKIGGFAGCVSLNLERYKKPILVPSTDGVGIGQEGACKKARPQGVDEAKN
jgi:phosphoribosylaminoimidazole (AIR) synthetase